MFHVSMDVLTSIIMDVGCDLGEQEYPRAQDVPPVISDLASLQHLVGDSPSTYLLGMYGLQIHAPIQC
jgi:hypothetical protein